MNVIEDDPVSVPAFALVYPTTYCGDALFWSIDTDSLLRMDLILNALGIIAWPSGSRGTALWHARTGRCFAAGPTESLELNFDFFD
jgi:hypothetical protein